MASALNKRQQARNERALQELIKSVPGNDRCADCEARNPGESTCGPCDPLTSDLGTHLSKVKSLSMDTWSNDQVDVSGPWKSRSRIRTADQSLKNMKRVGNVSSNRKFNPHNARASMPLDVDEVSSAMEKFIRQKYEEQSLLRAGPRVGTRHHTGSTSSDEPPPLPPKPAKRFAFGTRSASSTFATSSATQSDYETPPISPRRTAQNGGASPPGIGNKQSRVLGASVGVTGESHESKLARLREMGFLDEQRNALVLKGLNGSIERSIETLVKLGERSTRRVFEGTGDAAGISPRQSAAVGNNPFQRRATQPELQQAFQQASTAEAQASGPFDTSNQPAAKQSIEQSFQGLCVSQPLFPNATGGFPAMQQPHGYSHQPLTSPVPTMPQSYSYFATAQTQAQPQTAFPGTGGANPFFSQTLATPAYATLDGNLQYSQQTSSMQPLQPQQQQIIYNRDQMSQPSYQQQVSQPMLQPQRTGRADNSSIMALYNYPQLAPAAPPPMPGGPGTLTLSAPSAARPPTAAAGGNAQRSVSTPAGLPAGSRNPFLTEERSAGTGQQATGGAGGPGGAQANHAIRHVSQESVDVGGWQSGRHSPDAFASLSARSVR
ncbi:MAG: hypothetical protein M1832_000329 [Thelocarpon impressellum]|nr:MAG: hypothetical protein M1832_000329 [Thelocarpon impressellum]